MVINKRCVTLGPTIYSRVGGVGRCSVRYRNRPWTSDVTVILCEVIQDLAYLDSSSLSLSLSISVSMYLCL